MTLKCSKAGHTIRSPGDVDQNGHCLQCAEEKMNSYPRQAKEIESLTSQLSAARKLSDSLAELSRKQDEALYRQHTELMALREKVLLLEQRPLQSRLNTARESRDFWRRAAERLETEVEIAKEQSSHYKEKYRRVTDRRSVDSQMRDAPDSRAMLEDARADMREARDLRLGRRCDCPMCEARGM